MKRIATAAIIALTALSALIYSLGYHGPRYFSTATALPEPQTVVAHARRLSGTPYDPLMGKYGNIGAVAGFIVCSDVPNIAYGLAGFSLQKMLEEDFARHPTVDGASEGNRPGNPYFHRRARNLHAYFVANSGTLPPDGKPAVGDLAFYRGDPRGYVSHVALVTEVGAGGYRVMESAPETLRAQEVPGESPIARGWLPVGFGRMYR